MEMEMAGPQEMQGSAQKGKSFQTLSRRQLVGTIIGLQLTLLLAALDNTIVGTAMPKIIGQLNGFDRYAWVTTAYLLTSTIAVPIFGKLSDLFGRKWIYLGGAVFFVLTSALCGAAGEISGLFGGGMNQLIVFRGLQGLAAGVVTGLTFTVIGDIFPPAERGKYQGLFSGVWGLASVFGPTLGGWITDSLSWRWVFYVNLPVGIAAVTVLFFAFPDFRPEGVRRAIDWLGVTTLTASLVPLLLALTWVTDYSWTSPRIIGLLAFAVVMLGAFIYAESRAAEPIIPLSLFKSRIVAVSSFSLFMTGMGMFGGILFIPLFMQAVIGVSATRSGSLLTPMMLMLTFGSILSGQLISRLGRYKVMAFVGLAIMSGGMLMMAGMGIDTTQLDVIRNMIIVGFGLGLVMPLYTLIVQNAVPQQMLGAATASTQFFRSIGGTVGAAVFGSIMLGRYRDTFDAAVPQGVPAQALEPFRNPLQLSQLLPSLQQSFAQIPNGQVLLGQLMGNVKSSLVSAIGAVFLIGAIVVAASFIANIFLPEVALRKSFAPATTAEAPSPEGAYATGKAASQQGSPVAEPALAGIAEGDD
jgi:EmrB/QacA subfamily drug resistance transporter